MKVRAKLSPLLGGVRICARPKGPGPDTARDGTKTGDLVARKDLLGLCRMAGLDRLYDGSAAEGARATLGTYDHPFHCRRLGRWGDGRETEGQGGRTRISFHGAAPHLDTSMARPVSGSHEVSS